MSLFFLLILTNLFYFGQTLISCNETVVKCQLCSLVPDYEKGKPQLLSEQINGYQVRIASSVSLFSLDEFNIEQGSISLNVLLALWWNDTRLTLTPENINQ